LKKYPHTDVVGCIELFEDQEEVFLVYEYLPNGDLLHWLAKKKTITEAEAKRIFWSVASAVNHLHSLGVVHRDIKLENICVGKDGETKLVDFNLCSTWSPEKKLKTYCGSLCYCAPEICLAQPYTGPEVDVWSLGVLLYVLLFCRFPFDPAIDPPAKVKEAAREKKKYEFDKSVNSSDEEADLSGEATGLYDGLTEEQIKKKKMALRIVKAEFWFPADRETNPHAKALVSSMLVVETAHRATLPSVLSAKWLAEFNREKEKEKLKEEEKKEEIKDKKERRKTIDLTKFSYGKFGTFKESKKKEEQTEESPREKEEKSKHFFNISSRQLLGKICKINENKN
jgi:serine/threonine protein kinase